MHAAPHQYVDRGSGALRTEHLYQDRLVRFFYGRVRESVPAMFRMLVSRRSTALLGYLNYDTQWGSAACRRFLRGHGVDLGECVDDPRGFRTARDVFERRIRYWECRPMPRDPHTAVAPADSRVLVGSLAERLPLFIKNKFFEYAELLGRDRHPWLATFRDGDYAIFRLTPEKYHYNHAPVSGTVLDHYDIEGDYHSCNPGAALRVVSPYSKNRRVVTVIDTDVPGGTGIGKVAMVELVALMIGEIVQCVSRERYDDPQPLTRGLWLERGTPKSLFRPGSSTTLLVFEPGRIRFAPDLVANQARADARSRYSLAFGRSVVETDVRVRSPLAHARTDARRSHILFDPRLSHVE